MVPSTSFPTTVPALSSSRQQVMAPLDLHRPSQRSRIASNLRACKPRYDRIPKVEKQPASSPHRSPTLSQTVGGQGHSPTAISRQSKGLVAEVPSNLARGLSGRPDSGVLQLRVVASGYPYPDTNQIKYSTPDTNQIKSNKFKSNCHGQGRTQACCMPSWQS